MYVDHLSGSAGGIKAHRQPPDKGGHLLDSSAASLLLGGGSDGETSDYQRSTPSPRDSETSEGKIFVLVAQLLYNLV